MNAFLILFPLAQGTVDLLYAVPLVVSISCVYAATRHEQPEMILRRAIRVGVMITVFMAVILAVLMWASAGL